MRNVELCNGAERPGPDLQIEGCTAIIDSGAATNLILAVAHNNRGNAYTAKGDREHALADYARSLELNPNYALAFNNRGAAYLKAGDYARAIEDFDAAIKLDETYASAFANRADAYMRQGDTEKANRDYEVAIRLKPGAKEIRAGRCWLLAVKGDLNAALADCDEALRLEPSAAVFDSRGLVRFKLGQYEQAIADYSAALNLNPQQVSSLYGRGMSKLKSGDAANGNADIAAATALKSTIAAEFARYGVQ